MDLAKEKVLGAISYDIDIVISTKARDCGLLLKNSMSVKVQSEAEEGKGSS